MGNTIDYKTPVHKAFKAGLDRKDMKKFKGIRPAPPRRNYSKIAGWIIGFILVFSTFGFIFSYTNDQTTNYVYNGYTIQITTEGLALDLDDQRLIFTNYPESVIDYRPTPEITSLIRNSQALIVTYDPAEENPEPFGLTQFSLEQDLNTYVIRALTNNTGYALSEFSCSNSTLYVPVLFYKTGNKTSYYQDGNCIIGEVAIAEDTLRLKDALLYDLNGVFP